VRVLTAENVKKYTIHDVILPLPGHEVTYPDHDAAKWYEELMAKDNLSSASLKQNIR
jgi:tRNA pseudouridine13 synthase